MTQEQMFPVEQSPTAPPTSPRTTPRAAESACVPRSPGWVLVGTTTGPSGFHRIRSVGQNGSLVTACGLVGRKIEDSQRMIIECPACSTQT
jgi:hypothetical protein